MPNNRYQNYFEDEVLEANPLKLIELLYRGALDSIAAAKRYLRLGDIRARSRAISKAMAIVTELSLSLNHQDGGEISRNLAELYGYIEKLLIQANVEQCEPPLAEAERLLSTLLEGWIRCAQGQPASVAQAREPIAANSVHERISCAC
jgi:flagellar protein FliS